MFVWRRVAVSSNGAALCVGVTRCTWEQVTRGPKVRSEATAVSHRSNVPPIRTNLNSSFEREALCVGSAGVHKRPLGQARDRGTNTSYTQCEPHQYMQTERYGCGSRALQAGDRQQRAGRQHVISQYDASHVWG